MGAAVKTISNEDRQIAQTSLKLIKSKAGNLDKRKSKSVNIRINNSDIDIPQAAFSLLSDILSNMAHGKLVSLVPVQAEITTQQAADMLNVSRPFMVKLLEEGEIPFIKIGSHRRVLLKDVQDYAAKQQGIRKKQLAFLSKQAQKLNLGY